jgi:hypothetical protein
MVRRRDAVRVVHRARALDVVAVVLSHGIDDIPLSEYLLSTLPCREEWHGLSSIAALGLLPPNEEEALCFGMAPDPMRPVVAEGF